MAATRDPQAIRWLRRLYEHCDGGWVTLFTIDNEEARATLWQPVDDVAAFAAELERIGDASDVWFGVATRRERLTAGKRGGDADCLSVPALWLDVDIAGAAHAATNLPATEAEARELVGTFPLPPTAIVHSGHGLQGWWWLAEPLEASEADPVLKRWHATWDKLAADRGWRVDNVFDVARIMRLPGTTNCKTDPVPVRILEADAKRRYGLDDIEQWLIDPPTAETAPREPYTGAERPGDVFNDTHTGGELLAAAGWTLERTDRNGDTHWHRPGSANPSGATVYAKDGHTTIWTDTPGLPVRRPFDPFGLHVFLNHAGDFTAAAAALAPPRQQPQVSADIKDSESGISDISRLLGDAPDQEDSVVVAPDGFRLTDAGNAQRLVKLANGQLRYVHAWGRWVVYRNGRWVIDVGDALVTEQAKRVAHSLFRLLPAITDKDERARVFGWAIRSESSAAIAAMVRLARGNPVILTEHEQLDADPYLLNVANGTVDLRTGQLRPHDPDDLLTLQAPVRFDATADAPLWRACLERWQPDQVVRDYLQLEAGAGATGQPTETLSVHHGGGGNGKSKFFGALQHVLGEYTIVPHKSLLVTQRHEQHETVKADLFRKRLGVASETKAVDVLDDEQVKALTGGDRMRARRMREDPWYFWPTHTLVVITNHRPAIRGRDESMWRRVRLVPWEVTIPAAERDPDLADKLRAEAPGILNWIVEGARRFLADGFDPPPAVQAATADYRAEQDTVGRFIADALVLGRGWARSSDIRAELESWCDDQGVMVPSMKEITNELHAAGCRSDRRKFAGQKFTVWTGVSIADAPTDTPSDQQK